MTPHFSTPSWPNRIRPAFDGPTALPDQPLWLADRLTHPKTDETRTDAARSRSAELPCVYTPENYEANYPYPLIVWLSDPGHTVQELMEFAPRISTQNYLATALSGCGLLESLFRALTGIANLPVDETAERIYERVRQIRRCYHIHTERVYVAGCDLAATLALELLLQRPEWFAGMLGFGRVEIPHGRSLRHFRQLRGKRVFIGADLRQPRKALATFLRTGRLLHSAGLDVSARLYDANEPVTSEMLSDVNHWLMEGICASNLV
ncbi:MAG: hypothetical protein GXP27_13460 [Planctomycetes bacterium]|nr:hypothetical protein [Planctomycetota bacterium]